MRRMHVRVRMHSDHQAMSPIPRALDAAVVAAAIVVAAAAIVLL